MMWQVRSRVFWPKVVFGADRMDRRASQEAPDGRWNGIWVLSLGQPRCSLLQTGEIDEEARHDVIPLV